MMLRVVELFAGIGSQAKALKRLGVPHEVVCICEWDKYAYRSYEAIHGPTVNLGDITKVAYLPKCDLLTYSFPCQDLSVAGKGAGIKVGTRSGLLFEVERLLENCDTVGELPRYLLLENVKNLVGKKNKPDFDRWLAKLSELGYNNYWNVLNAKDYGIPQNRERVFVVSILKQHDNFEFRWCDKFDNGVRLKHLLEDEVDKTYYVSDEKVQRLISQFNPKQNTQSIPLRFLDRNQKNLPDGYAMCVDTTNTNGVAVKEATKLGYAVASEGDSINLEQPNSKTRRGRVGKECAQTITTSPQQAVVETDAITRYRIRKLTPKECWRLMGFDDEDFDKAAQVNSNSQLYKQAGNSIVVNVLELIFKAMLANER